jgi:hypothetical protein
MFFFALSSVLAQSCTPDLLVDNYSKANLSLLITENPAPMRYFNLLGIQSLTFGGDYGAKDAAITVDPITKTMQIIPGWGPGKSNTRLFTLTTA